MILPLKTGPAAERRFRGPRKPGQARACGASRRRLPAPALGPVILSILCIPVEIKKGPLARALAVF